MLTAHPQYHASQSIFGHAPFVAVAYATKLNRNWTLGLTASFWRVPLILVGAGLQWDGFTAKIAGVQRAAQVVEHLAPGTPIMYLDGTDTAIANALTPAAAAKLQEIRADDSRIVLGTECGLWPTCRKDVFLALEEQRYCQAHWPACFPNSGVLVGHPRALMRFGSDVISLMETPTMEGSWNRSQHNGDMEDQSGVQDLYLRQRDFNFTIEVDGPSTFMMSLKSCHKRRYPSRTNCINADYEPDYTLDLERRQFRLNASGHVQMPLALHSNGDPTLRALTSSRIASLALPPSNGTLRHMVILIDSSTSIRDVDGLCGTTQFSKLLDDPRVTSNTAGRPWSTSSVGRGR